MTGHNNEVVEARGGGRPHGQRLYDTAKERDIPSRRGAVEVERAKVEQEGECEEGGEEDGAEVGQACGGTEELGEGTWGGMVEREGSDSASLE
jgi:hypothetical protein